MNGEKLVIARNEAIQKYAIIVTFWIASSQAPRNDGAFLCVDNDEHGFGICSMKIAGQARNDRAGARSGLDCFVASSLQ